MNKKHHPQSRLERIQLKDEKERRRSVKRRRSDLSSKEKDNELWNEISEEPEELQDY